MSRFTPLFRQARPFGLLWLAASAPLLLYVAVYRDSAPALLGFVGQLLVACLLAALPVESTRRVLQAVGLRGVVDRAATRGEICAAVAAAGT